MPRKKTIEDVLKSPIKLSSLTIPDSRPKRDKRRAFTQTQKKELLYQQDNKCARCHEKLDPRAIQVDHGKPWASGGRNITENGRALCSTCHDIVSHEQRLEKIEGKKSPKKAQKTSTKKKVTRKRQYRPFIDSPLF